MRIVFTHKNKEICVYTGPRYGRDEEQATKELLAYERGIDIDEIHISFQNE